MKWVPLSSWLPPSTKGDWLGFPRTFPILAPGTPFLLLSPLPLPSSAPAKWDYGSAIRCMSWNQTLNFPGLQFFSCVKQTRWIRWVRILPGPGHDFILKSFSFLFLSSLDGHEESWQWLSHLSLYSAFHVYHINSAQGLISFSEPNITLGDVGSSRYRIKLACL